MPSSVGWMKMFEFQKQNKKWSFICLWSLILRFCMSVHVKYQNNHNTIKFNFVPKKKCNLNMSIIIEILVGILNFISTYPAYSSFHFIFKFWTLITFLDHYCRCVIFIYDATMFVTSHWYQCQQKMSYKHCNVINEYNTSLKNRKNETRTKILKKRLSIGTKKSTCQIGWLEVYITKKN